MRVLLLAALALALVPAASAAQSVTYTFTSYTTVQQPHDTKPKGKVNAGDSIDFKDLLVNTAAVLGKAKGKAVGYDAGTVLYTSATAQKIEGISTFPGVGTLTFVGVMKTLKDGTVHIPVIKGTGVFKGARGTLIIGEGTSKAPNTYVLKLPHAPCVGTCA